MSAFNKISARCCPPPPRIYPLFFLLLSAFPLCLQAQDPAVPLEASPASLELVPRSRYFDGKVEAVHQATVSSQTSGRVAEVFYDVDDYVEAGAVIVRFTNVEQQSALQQAEASLREARARQVEAEEEYRRALNLQERGVGSQRDVDRTLASREAAGARVLAAESAVETAAQQLEYTLVRAPYAGIVTSRHVEVGEAVTTGQPLMSGLSLERLRVVVELPQGMAQLVRESPMAEVLTEDGPVAPKRITVFPVADPLANTFTVRLELPDGQFGFYPGMFVKVAFLVSEAERLLVPAAAIVRRSELTAVYVVSGDSARLRQVRLGQRFGDRVEVLSGIGPGEMIAHDPVAAGIWLKGKRED